MKIVRSSSSGVASLIPIKLEGDPLTPIASGIHWIRHDFEIFLDLPKYKTVKSYISALHWIQSGNLVCVFI